MKIFTSYFASKNLDRSRHYLVQVSNSAPGGFEADAKLVEVVPNWDTIVKPYKSGEISEMTYLSRYKRQLDDNTFSVLLALDGLTKQAAGKDIVLLCYEKSGGFCHRHILGEWLKSKKEQLRAVCPDIETYEIEELNTGQMSLF